MAKSGTMQATAHKMKSASKSGVRHGQAHKNVTTGAKSKPSPSSGRTGPLKGPDRGGV